MFNSTFAIGEVSPIWRGRLCPADSFVVAESFVLRINPRRRMVKIPPIANLQNVKLSKNSPSFVQYFL